MIWKMWFEEKVGGEYFFGEGEYFFSMNNQRYGRWGMVRGEEALCCQVKTKIDQQLIFSWFLSDVLTGWTILLKSTPINQ
jgi:hypothetical protein